MRTAALVVAVLCAVALSGCALAPPPSHPDIVERALPPATEIPPAWRAGAGAADVATGWIGTLDDPVLVRLVAEAIANNVELREAAARVEIARQAAVLAGSRMMPWVGAQLGASSVYDYGNGTYNAEHATAGVSWEIDVWGRLRAQRAAAEANAEAAVLDYAWARQSIAAAVADLWYLNTEARQLVALSERAVSVYAELLRLVEARRDAGKVSDLDVVDVQARLETAQAEAIAVKQTEGEARRGLEVLLGRYPAAEIETAAAYPPLPPPVGAGVPSSLLVRRPDLAAAEREVLAAFRRQEAAKLALLPGFTLSFSVGRLHDQVLSLLRLNPWLASVSAGVSIPIYDGGALRAKLAIATAQQEQAVARYGVVALTAFREVENALAAEELVAARMPYAQRALNDQREMVRIATVQYRSGRIDLLWVTQLQAVELAAEANVIKLAALQRVNRIRLHLVLGGSFEAESAPLPPEAAAAPTL